MVPGLLFLSLLSAPVGFPSNLISALSGSTCSRWFPGAESGSFSEGFASDLVQLSPSQPDLHLQPQEQRQSVTTPKRPSSNGTG